MTKKFCVIPILISCSIYCIDRQIRYGFLTFKKLFSIRHDNYICGIYFCKHHLGLLFLLEQTILEGILSRELFN